MFSGDKPQGWGHRGLSHLDDGLRTKVVALALASKRSGLGFDLNDHWPWPWPWWLGLYPSHSSV